MPDIVNHLPDIIEAIGVILIGFWSYNQYTKNKMTDLKVEELKREEKKKAARRNDTISRIYFDLYRLLMDLKADRVYILQPHPLIVNHYVSVAFEVRQKGISEIRPQIQDVPISEFPIAIEKLAKRDWLVYRDIEKEMSDKRVKSFLKTSGTYGIFVRRLSTEKDGWVGSLTVDYLEQPSINLDYVRSLVSEVADTIQYILPEIPEKD